VGKFLNGSATIRFVRS